MWFFKGLIMKQYKLIAWLIMLFLVMVGNANAIDEEESEVTYPPVMAFSNFDLNKFLGKWYEIARLPLKDEKYTSAPITIDYSTPDNSGIIKAVTWYKLDESMESSTVVLRQQKGVAKNIGKLEINYTGFGLRHLGIGWTDYWVIAVDADYTYALVGAPDREYLWLLCRTDKPDPAKIKLIFKKAASLGFTSRKNIVWDYPQFESLTN